MKKLIIFLTILQTLLLSSVCYSEIARIEDVNVTVSPTIKASFTVRGAFTSDIEEAVQSGMPTSFNFIVVLNRINSIWFNETVNRLEFKHTVKYDTLKEEYQIKNDDTGEEVRTKDFGEMSKIMTKCSIGIATPAPLVKGEEYELKIMAELHTIRLPFMLDFVLFFTKFWDSETDWYSYRFSP